MNKRVTKRYQVRELAVQTLFQLIDAPDYLTVDEAMSFALEAGSYPEEGYDEVGDKYLYTLIEGVQNNLTALDQQIEKYLTNWSLERLARIDLTILRLAFFEIFYVSDEEVPNNVAVDEAIDLAKIFSDDKSRKFISGLLANVLAAINEDKTEE